MGLFGADSSTSSASGQSESGIGRFAPHNRISTGRKVIDFDFGEPVQVVGLLIVLTLGYLAWKRFK